ncbi:MAG TPA: hypothetical protein VMG61_17080 [Usitatibacter sp.]|nr:hypothetical protein [Usitatibacter sp.]
MGAIAAERIFVTWTQQWSIDDYVENYLRTRRLGRGESARAAVFACLARYTGRAPLCKSDLDFFLDANLARR